MPLLMPRLLSPARFSSPAHSTRLQHGARVVHGGCEPHALTRRPGRIQGTSRREERLEE